MEFLFGLAFVAAGVFGWKWFQANNQLRIANSERLKLQRDLEQLQERAAWGKLKISDTNVYPIQRRCSA